MTKSEKIDFFSNVVFSSTKLIFEFTAILLLCFLILFSSELSGNGEELIAYLSVITVLIIRMLPLFNSILSESNKLQFRYGSVYTVIKILENFNNESKKTLDNNNIANLPNPIKYEKMLSIKNLSFEIFENKILKNINVEIEKGSKIALVGSSGSGKTTLLNCISQLYNDYGHAIYSDNCNISPSSRDWKKLVSYMPQEAVLINDSLAKNIALGVNDAEINYEKLNRAIDISCSKEFIDKLPNKEKTILGQDGLRLSGGQAQRICMARALYKNFEILLMDEPTSSIDNELENHIFEKLFKLCSDKTIIVSLHKLELLNRFDYIMVLDNNKLLNYQKIVDIYNSPTLLQFLDKLKLNQKYENKNS